ncbi:MAG: tail fiber domain-containing protein, partial [bacterium]
GAISAGTYSGIAGPSGGMIISGNVGIGTTGPDSVLHVIGSSSNPILTVRQNQSSGQPATASFVNSGGTTTNISYLGQLVVPSGGGVIASSYTSNGLFLSGVDVDLRAHSNNSGSILFSPGSSEKMRITTTGNVGIGTTNPTYKLEVNGNISLNEAGLVSDSNLIRITQGRAVFGYNGTLGEAYFGSGAGKNLAFQAGGSTYMFMSSAGNVGIGTTGPNQKLEVAGNIRLIVGSGASSPVDLYIEDDGDLTTSTSDLRVKNSLEPLEGTLEGILKLKPYSFHWINDSTGKRDIGLIAQEVQEIFPGIVYTNKSDGYMGINYSRFATLLVKAVQEEHLQLLELNDTFREFEKATTERLDRIEERLKILEENANIEPVLSPAPPANGPTPQASPSASL